MEARRRAVAVATILACLSGTAYAASLDSAIPGLFGGTLATSITPRDVADAQRPRVADRFSGLSAALSVTRSQVPVPSAAGSFGYVLEPEYDAYVRVPLGLGPMFGERAQTLGRGIWTFGASYSHAGFDTLDGVSLDNVRSSQPALSDTFVTQLPQADRQRAIDNTLDVQLQVNFNLDMLFLNAAVGVTDRIDLSATLSVNRAHLRVKGLAVIRDPAGNGGVYFSGAQRGVIIGGTGACAGDFQCASDTFDQTSVGTGDLFLRGKWHFADTAVADLAAVAVVSLPTGNAADFLGYHDPTFTPWLVASKSIGPLEPHVNLGYAFRSHDDVSQAQWIAGADWRVAPLITLGGDFLGYHDDRSDGLNDDIVQSAVTLKVNPLGDLVAGASFQFPVNRDGLRADVIYTGQIEYTF